MRRDIKDFSRKCDLCQRTKGLNYRMEGGYQFVASNCPNDVVSADFYGPLPTSPAGVRYLFVIQDWFSKYFILYPIKAANTKTCLDKLTKRNFFEIGRPNRIFSDNGTQFTAHAWRATLESYGIRVSFSSVRHPQSNPVERTMRELGRLFRTYCSGGHTAWGRHVSFVQDVLNFS